MTKVILNKFNTTMTSDARELSSSCQLCQHFDNFTKSHSLIPYKSTESAYASQATNKYQSFLMYNGLLYALGVVAGGGIADIALFTGVDNPSVSDPTNSADASGTSSFNLFVEYKGVLYGASAGTRIWSYNIGTVTFTATARSITYTNIAQGLVHSKDDILYIPYDNKIAKNNAGSWTDTALTLPSNLYITSVCEYGNYLAIACKSLYANSANSVVYLWDRDSTLTTLSESIDWGNEDLYLIENINGYLVGVSVHPVANSSFNSKLVFSKYSGGSAVVFNEILCSSGVAVRGKQKVNNRLYFGVSGTSVGGTTNDYTGVWSIGINKDTGQFFVQLDRIPNNGTSTSAIKGFILVQDFMYISALDATASDAFILSKTDDQTNYTATSVYSTVINPNMQEQDKFSKKQLVAVGLTYSPLPTAGQVVLKYKVDGGAYTTIFTETTDSAVSTEKTTDTNGVQFTAGRQYEFRIESTGGAEITGLIYKYGLLDSQI